MKILGCVQKRYKTLGISPSTHSSQKCSFNIRIIFGFFLFAYLIVAQFVYILHVAHGFMQYMGCICSASAGIIVFVCFAAVVFRKTTVFECMDQMNKLIHTSEPLLCHYTYKFVLNFNQILFQKL